MSTVAKVAQPFWVMDREARVLSRHDTYIDAFEHFSWLQCDLPPGSCYIQEQRLVESTQSVNNMLVVSAAERDALHHLMEYVDYLSPQAADAMWSLNSRIKANV